MSGPFIIWDLDDEHEGNVQHCAEHGVTKEEVREVVNNPTGHGLSRTSGLPAVFGYTSTGRYLIVVYEQIDDETIYPMTAYDVPEENSS